MENDKSLVLHVHAIHHKTQQLTKQLLLKGPNACADASNDASTVTDMNGTKILLVEIIYDATLM